MELIIITLCIVILLSNYMWYVFFNAYQNEVIKQVKILKEKYEKNTSL